jgi:hypothetical protein
LRSQLTRNITLTIATKDGVSRSYLIRDRRVSSHPGPDPGASCIITFNTAAQASRIFLASNAIGQIVEGLSSREVELIGEATTVLWFYEMTMGLVPWRRPRAHVMPDAYVAHDPNSKVADRITREPAVEALDPAWTGAVAQREKLLMWRVAAGAEDEGKYVHHKIVVDVSQSTTGADQ